MSYANAHFHKVIVIFLGLGVRVAKRYRMKRLLVREEMEKAECGEIQQDIRTSEEIPFGVKAIEQGYEVEGVWNSRATTPLHSPALSSRGSSPARSANKLRKSNRESSVSSISILDMPENAQARAGPSKLTKQQQPSQQLNTSGIADSVLAGGPSKIQENLPQYDKRGGHTHIITHPRNIEPTDITNRAPGKLFSPRKYMTDNIMQKNCPSDLEAYI